MTKRGKARSQVKTGQEKKRSGLVDEHVPEATVAAGNKQLVNFIGDRIEKYKRNQQQRKVDALEFKRLAKRVVEKQRENEILGHVRHFAEDEIALESGFKPGDTG